MGPDDDDDDPIAISTERYDRTLRAAVECTPSLAAWIVDQGESVHGSFEQIRSLLRRLRDDESDEVLKLIREERVGALHDFLARLDAELYAPLEAPGEATRYFGTLHHDYVALLDTS